MSDSARLPFSLLTNAVEKGIKDLLRPQPIANTKSLPKVWGFTSPYTDNPPVGEGSPSQHPHI